MKGTILKTAGIITIGVGMYIVYKGIEADGDLLTPFEIDTENVIDIDFEVIED